MRAIRTRLALTAVALFTAAGAAAGCAGPGAGAPGPAGPEAAAETIGENSGTPPTIGPTGDAGGVDNGGGDNGGTDNGGGSNGGGPAGTVTDPPVAPSAEDCISYNAATLTVEAFDGAWRLVDGVRSLKLFDTKSDAETGRALARNWTRMCFIGRNNTRPDRYRYIITYWRQASGLPLGLAPALECVPYDKTKLAVYPGAAQPATPDWALHSGDTLLLYLDTAANAQRAKLVAAENTKLCYIGRGNARPDPYRYVMEYWRP